MKISRAPHRAASGAPQPDRRRFLSTGWWVAGLLLLGPAWGAGCGLFGSSVPPEPVLETKVLNIYLDRLFNQGQELPVDIAYATKEQPVQLLTGYGPQQWFEGKKRDEWPYKQGLMLNQGTSSPWPVTLNAPPHCNAMVVFANYLGLVGPRGQMAVFDAKSKPEEVVFVTGKGLFR
ncbi:MAG: hypothetical protein KQJ78_08250 [Deltaproteobacteria bacterium]|nr:hypothetical protein [Deltaproteobacteria bacterium]